MATRQGRDDAPNPVGRQQARDALMNQAMQRPEIRTVMRVYEDWKRADRVLASHCSIAGWRGTVSDWPIVCDAG
ncbi:MAG: hypothetical protein F4X60_00760 [Gemmatimonadetes bacterium]|nr:hypothetical protein [Gemmatimonadota bacterium]MYB97075.1 hypothetical protein [Gemmatimonadota bacterium]